MFSVFLNIAIVIARSFFVDKTPVSDSASSISDVSREDSQDEILEQVDYFSINKLDINHASYDDFMHLPFITPSAIQKIIAFQKNKRNMTEKDLRLLIGDKLASEILPMIEFKNEERTAPAFLELAEKGLLLKRSRLDFESRTHANFPYEPYLGPPLSLYSRMQIRVADNFFVSALMEKDIGEERFWDFYSFSLQASNIYNLKTLVVGDYNLRFANGLVTRTASYTIKSTEFLPAVTRAGKELQAYTSVRERNFFRGAAAEIEWNIFKVIGFYSNVNQDATLLNDGAFSALSVTGLHLTKSELSKKDNLNEQCYGGRLTFRPHFGTTILDISANALRTEYSKTYKRENLFHTDTALSANAITNLSADFSLLLEGTNFYGELAALLETSSFAGIIGATTEITEGITAELSFRYYDANYFSPKATAFSESATDASGEIGIFSSLSLKILKWWTLSGYVDIFWKPSPSQAVFSKGIGSDFQVKSSFTINETLNLLLYVQRKGAETNSSVPNEASRSFKIIQEENYWRTRVELQFEPTSDVALRTRVEAKFASEKSGNIATGWLLYQQIQASLFKKKIYALGRVSVFQTDNFSSAIYTYEVYVPLVSLSPARYGSGYSFLLNVRAKILDRLELSTSYSFTSQKKNEDVDPVHGHSLWASLNLTIVP